MDGLNCNEINFSELNSDNPIFRLDSEFFSREILSIDNKIKAMPCFYLNSDDIVSGPFGSSLKSDSYLENGDIPFVRIENIRGGFDINMDNIIYISRFDNERIKNSQLQTNDIVLSKVGNSIGFFARVDESIGVCNISENNIGIKLSSYSEAEKHYILTYLNCRFAQKLVLRRTSGNAQPKLNVGDLSYIPIPLFSSKLSNAISACILNSKAHILESKQLFVDAQKLLVDRIGFSPEQLPTQSHSVKPLSCSFGVTGRLDAEYYQPKYEAIEHQFSGHRTIKKTCSIHDVNFIPSDAEQYRYIELADVDMSGGISPLENTSGADLPTRARRLVRPGQVIISSIEGSLQSCALVTEDFDGTLCSTGFYVLDSKEYNPETLLILFKSEPIQALLKKRCSGTILTAISKEEFEKVPIPEVDDPLQNEIAAKVHESFALRNASKKLLEIAVKTVELAIEVDEESALQWLESQY